MVTGCGLRGCGEFFLVGRIGEAQGRIEALTIVKALDVRRTPWFDEPQEGRVRRLPGFERAVDVQFRVKQRRRGTQRNSDFSTQCGADQRRDPPLTYSEVSEVSDVIFLAQYFSALCGREQTATGRGAPSDPAPHVSQVTLATATARVAPW